MALLAFPSVTTSPAPATVSSPQNCQLSITLQLIAADCVLYQQCSWKTGVRGKQLLLNHWSFRMKGAGAGRGSAFEVRAFFPNPAQQPILKDALKVHKPLKFPFSLFAFYYTLLYLCCLPFSNMISIPFLYITLIGSSGFSYYSFLHIQRFALKSSQNSF